MERHPRGRVKPFLMRLIGPPFVAVVQAIQRVRVVGDCDLPTSGPLIVAANHTNHFDGPVLAAVLYRRGIPPCAAVRADLFKVPVLGWWLKHLGQIPIYRPGVASTPLGGTGQSSIRALVRGLEEGKCLIVFPEGTFTSDPQGWPMAGKTGLARLVLAHPETVVVPCAHWGNEGLVDSTRKKVCWRRVGRRRTRVDLCFGAPLDFSEYFGRPVTHELLTEMTAFVMEAITEELLAIRR